MLERAEHVIEDLGNRYLGWLGDDVGQLAMLVAQARKDAKQRAELLDKLSFVANDMKGQGATFGFPLVTMVCQSICDFLNRADRTSPITVEVVGIHVDSLKIMLRDRVAGDGGPIGQQLVEALSLLVDKVSK